MNSDLNRIKKKYGENFAHLCRELFPTILETEGLLPDIIESKFYPNKFLYDDIINNNLELRFQSFINGLLVKEETIKINKNKTPYELLNEAGYILYECKTNEDIQKFKNYYKKEEMLCTFRDNCRLKRNYVFFAVKKNVDDIKRENFNHPEREDEYGTSVISLQFTRTYPNYLSIKNRYNNTVSIPDATFNNNLDNIIPGLTKSFENTYNLCGNSTSQYFNIPNYVLAKDERYYKYNYELNNIYYCTDNIIIDNFQVKKYEKERYIIFDYFILDLKEKTINLYDDSLEESFCKYHKSIEKIEIKKEKDKKYILLKQEGHQIIIVLDNENKMISYYNDLVTNINDNFLYDNKYLKSIYLKNTNTIGDNFIWVNEKKLNYIYIPSLMKVKDKFLKNNKELKEISFPNLEYIGNDFMTWNKVITKVVLPRLNEIGNNFMSQNLSLKYLELPQAIKIGDNFVQENTKLSFLYAPKLEGVGNSFLENNNSIKSFELPNLKYFGNFFLMNNEVLKELKLPTLEKFKKYSLKNGLKFDVLEIPENMYALFKKDLIIDRKNVKKLILVKK